MNLTDINECDEETHNCPNFARCVNVPGDYDCECRIGFEGDGFTCTGMIRSHDSIEDILNCVLQVASPSMVSSDAWQHDLRVMGCHSCIYSTPRTGLI